MAAPAADWAEQIRAGNVRAVARAITAVENRDPSAEALLERLFPSTGGAYMIGVTGAPGTGKSTLVNRLAAHYRSRNATVGIVAVDPTSPYTGGSILGDRIRMQGHAGDDGTFIRSMATRGSLGGLARATADVALLLDAAGKQIILIETVGVGQDEIDIVRLADCTLVLVVPGLGDDVQSMKAGLMEVADIFVLNKAEREGADRLEEQLQAMLQLAPEDSASPVVVRTTATEGHGVPELAAAIDEFRGRQEASGRRVDRARERWKERLVTLVEEQIVERTIGNKEGRQRLETLAAQVADRKTNPYAAARELAARGGI